MVINMRKAALAACFPALMTNSADVGRPPPALIASVSDDGKQLCPEFIAVRSPLSWAVRIKQVEITGQGGTPVMSRGQRERLGAGIG